MDINVELKTLSSSDLVSVGNKDFVLSSIAGCKTWTSCQLITPRRSNRWVGTFECLVTRIRGSATSDSPSEIRYQYFEPFISAESVAEINKLNLLVRPVSIDIPANTRAGRDSLTILAPKSIGSLRVYEA